MDDDKDIDIAFGQYRDLDFTTEEYDIILQGITVNLFFALFIHKNKDKIEFYNEEMEDIIKTTINRHKDKTFYIELHEGSTVGVYEMYHLLIEYPTMNKLMMEMKMGKLEIN